jgi:hypothetical protein
MQDKGVLTFVALETDGNKRAFVVLVVLATNLMTHDLPRVLARSRTCLPF